MGTRYPLLLDDLNKSIVFQILYILIPSVLLTNIPIGALMTLFFHYFFKVFKFFHYWNVFSGITHLGIKIELIVLQI